MECKNGTIGSLPSCQKMQCDLPFIDNGYLRYNGTARNSEWSQYQCYSGFRLQNNSVSKILPFRPLQKLFKFSHIASLNELADLAKYSELSNSFAQDNGWVKCVNGTLPDPIPACVAIPLNCTYPRYISNGKLSYNRTDGALYRCYSGYSFAVSRPQSMS